MRPMQARCPAATLLEGPPAGGPSVVCGALANEKRRADQVGEGESAHPHLLMRDFPTSIQGFCCGEGLPVIESVPEDPDRVPANYTACPIWRTEVERLRAGLERLAAPPVKPSLEIDPNPAPVGMGDLLR